MARKPTEPGCHALQGRVRHLADLDVRGMGQVFAAGGEPWVAGHFLPFGGLRLHTFAEWIRRGRKREARAKTC
jgi:hypothetical protein